MSYIFTTILVLFALIGSTTAQQKTPTTFTIQKGSEVLTVTQHIDNDFLGLYNKAAGNQQWEYGLYKDGQSFYYEQTLSDPFNNKYDWDATQRKPMHWGVLVEDGKIVKRMVKEYQHGKMQNFEAMVLYYKLDNNEVYDVLLYEKEGQFYLESANKSATVASVID